MSSKSEKFLEEFHKHIIGDSTTGGYILLKDEALYMLRGVFENYPFLEGAVNKHNKYRIHILSSDFNLFFLPAIRYLYED